MLADEKRKRKKYQDFSIAVSGRWGSDVLPTRGLLGMIRELTLMVSWILLGGGKSKGFLYIYLDIPDETSIEEANRFTKLETVWTKLVMVIPFALLR